MGDEGGGVQQTFRPGCLLYQVFTESRQTQSAAIFVVRAGGLGMKVKSIDTAIDEIVAACDGNVRGALEVLLLLNENLEAELDQLYATLSGEDHEHSSLIQVH